MANNLVYGWGINDVDYNVYKYEQINGKSKRVWKCPYYADWANMLQRCFGVSYQDSRPTYKTCTISEDWRYLSNFIRWVDSQPNRDWRNCSLDKDFLSEGNKHYSPETCVYISKGLNSFITDSGARRGEFMLGVCDSRRKAKPYTAQCRNPFTGKGHHIGNYITELEAHFAWKAKKHEYSLKLAELQSDPRVSLKLKDMYSCLSDFTTQ